MRKFFTRQKTGGVLSLLSVLLLIFFIATSNDTYAQTQPKITVTGSVTDSTGNVIPGASIVAANDAKNGAITGNNGRFVIDVAPGTILKISYIGYHERSVTVTAGTKTLNIVLLENSIQASEVVITA
ncbi:MAG: hypothetical protein EOP51_35175, partial [Sphingobacteriales bacterium]